MGRPNCSPTVQSIMAAIRSGALAGAGVRVSRRRALTVAEQMVKRATKVRVM
jgi:hypothetical protein